MSDQIKSLQAAATPHLMIILDAIRCWRTARDDGYFPQPCLFRILSPHNADFIVPALDSVMTFYECHLGRPLSVGDTVTISDDESWLLSTLIGVATKERSTTRVDFAANILECAIRSTRAILAGLSSAPQSLDLSEHCASRRSASF